MILVKEKILKKIIAHLRNYQINNKKNKRIGHPEKKLK